MGKVRREFAYRKPMRSMTAPMAGEMNPAVRYVTDMTVLARLLLTCHFSLMKELAMLLKGSTAQYTVMQLPVKIQKMS